MSKPAGRMKKVLDLIKTRPQRLTDLVEAAKMFPGGLAMGHNQQVLRVLEELEGLGLVFKDQEGRYVFRYNMQTYDSYDHWRFLVDHSEKILEGKKRVEYDLSGGTLKLIGQAWKAARVNHEKTITISNARRLGVDAYNDEKLGPGREEAALGRMFLEHLETGYPDVYTCLNHWYDSLNTKRRYVVELSNAVKTLLPDSKEYFNMKINSPDSPDSPIIKAGLGDGLDRKLTVSSEIVDELKRLLRYKPSLTEIPCKVGLFGLKIGALKLNMSRGLSNEVIKSLPYFKPLFVVIKEWNEYEDLVENTRGVIINAFSEIEALVRSGSPLKGVCSGCRDIIIKGNEI